MLHCEQHAEEVSQEAEGLKDSPELSPTLATTAQFPCQVSGLSLVSERGF